jgi:drug/metabolite transporter (DMT)-like permease
MAGLARTDAATASLLLTLEGAATALMAWFIFHENFDRRIAIGMLCLLGGAVVLAWSGAPTLRGALGSLAIVGACIVWGSTTISPARSRWLIRCRSWNSRGGIF